MARKTWQRPVTSLNDSWIFHICLRRYVNIRKWNVNFSRITIFTTIRVLFTDILCKQSVLKTERAQRRRREREEQRVQYNYCDSSSAFAPLVWSSGVLRRAKRASSSPGEYRSSWTSQASKARFQTIDCTLEISRNISTELTSATPETPITPELLQLAEVELL